MLPKAAQLQRGACPSLGLGDFHFYDNSMYICHDVERCASAGAKHVGSCLAVLVSARHSGQRGRNGAFPKPTKTAPKKAADPAAGSERDGTGTRSNKAEINACQRDANSEGADQVCRRYHDNDDILHRTHAHHECHGKPALASSIRQTVTRQFASIAADIVTAELRPRPAPSSASP